MAGGLGRGPDWGYNHVVLFSLSYQGSGDDDVRKKRRCEVYLTSVMRLTGSRRAYALGWPTGWLANLSSALKTGAIIIIGWPGGGGGI